LIFGFLWNAWFSQKYKFKFIHQQNTICWKSVLIFIDLKKPGWIHIGIPRISLIKLYKLFSSLRCVNGGAVVLFRNVEHSGTSSAPEPIPSIPESPTNWFPSIPESIPTIPGIPSDSVLFRAIPVRSNSRNSVPESHSTPRRNKQQYHIDHRIPESVGIPGIPCNSGITTCINIVSCYIHRVMNRFRSGIPESLRIPGIPCDSV